MTHACAPTPRRTAASARKCWAMPPNRTDSILSFPESSNPQNTMNELYFATLSDLRRRLAAREISAEAAVRACLDRIAATEPQVHALLTVDSAQALETARALDNEGPDPSKALWGVPVT